MSGSLPPRERLVEADLAEQLSVSRTPLREALQQLESEGFAERLLGGGLVVAGLDEPDLKNLLWLRLVLECELAREVARFATPADVADLTRILDQMEPVSDHPPLFIELGRGFHDRLATIFGNERCRVVLRQVRQHSDRYWNLTTAHQPERTVLAAAEHRAILAAIRSHDEETAVKRMRAHILAETEVCLAAVRATQVDRDSSVPNEAAAS